MMCSADRTGAWKIATFATAAFEEWSADTHSGLGNSALLGEFGRMAMHVCALAMASADAKHKTFLKSRFRYKPHGGSLLLHSSGEKYHL